MKTNYNYSIDIDFVLLFIYMLILYYYYLSYISSIYNTSMFIFLKDLRKDLQIKSHHNHLIEV